ncbi:MAG: hypothetical protein HW373_450, partial [Deltaproteobacteria bacterium]|nr:hypothetical protein [Deltaproteobacteria bacterium]
MKTSQCLSEKGRAQSFSSFVLVLVLDWLAHPRARGRRTRTRTSGGAHWQTGSQGLAWALAGLLGLGPLAWAADQAAVIQTDRVNVRAQPSIYSEVLTQLNTGDPVTVLEEITPEKPGPEEPTKWAKIVMPTNTPVWVFAAFVDPAAKTVKARRLNLRAGPGENYSIVGRLETGAAVKEIRVQDEWMEIETPPGAYGFVAAEFLAPPPPAEAAPPPPPPVVEPKKEEPPPPVVPPQAEPTAPAAAAPAPLAPPPVVNDEPPPKRIVRREGVVRRTASIQAASDFGLHSLDTGKLINYLHASAPELAPKKFHGKKVLVTGEESVD